MKKNICLLLIAALMCSCAGQDNGKDDFITIEESHDLTKVIKANKTYLLQVIINSFSLLSL